MNNNSTDQSEKILKYNLLIDILSEMILKAKAIEKHKKQLQGGNRHEDYSR